MTLTLTAQPQAAPRPATGPASKPAGGPPEENPAQAAAPGTEPPAITLAGQIELARLVDLASQRLRLNVEYDEAALKGTVTLRIGGSITDEELWALVNQLLAARGFTTVQGSGNALSVVKIADAPGLAPLQDQGESGGPGFVTVAARVRYRPVKGVVEALNLVLSKPSGKAQVLPGTSLVLVADFAPRVDRALELLGKLDAPDSAVTLVEVPVHNLAASQLATIIGQVQAKAEAQGGLALSGDLLPSTTGESLLLIAPADQADAWTALIARLDQRPPAETRTYSPGAFTAPEVGTLIEQSVHAGGTSGPSGPADGWRLIVEDLTGTIILTASPDQHARVEALLARLAALPAGERRPVRSFVVRNRSVVDLVGILQQLIGTGALDAAEEPTDASAANARPGSTSSNPSAQRTERAVLPPGTTTAPPSAEPVTSPTTTPTQAPQATAAARGKQPALPPITLTADEGTSTIIAVGEPRLLAQVERIIRQLDVRQPQVMLEVMLVSLTDGQALNLGVELEKLEIGSDAVLRLASLFGLSRLDGLGRTTGEAHGFSGVVLDPGDFAVVVRALETVNEGRSLSRPKLLVNNGQQAVFNSVLEQPFISTNASDTVATTSFGGTQDAGTTVTMRPQIAEADHLVLEYTISLSAFVGAASSPALPPPRQQNQVQSVATIPDGYTVVVGGLETTNTGNTVEQVPFIARVPIIGELFKNRTKSNNRTRFFVFLRADVMRGESFESLKYASDRAKEEAALDDGWPEVEPVVMR